MSGETRDLLTEARNLILDEEAWCTGSFARRSDGQGCASWDREAVRWCSMGAVAKVAGEVGIPSFNRATSLLYDAARDLGHATLMTANDWGGHEVVLEVFRLAIERAR